MPGDNLKQFLNDWDDTFANINTRPDEVFLEQIFRMQLEKSNIMKPLLALYWQDVTQRKEPTSYA